MKYSFTCFGHENITATHKTTLMFTKDDFVTKKGDCIVGCKCDFDSGALKRFIETAKKTTKKIVMTITTNEITQEVKGALNEDFDDPKDIVIRKSDFASKRTLLHGADHCAMTLPSAMRRAMASPDNRILVCLEPIA